MSWKTLVILAVVAAGLGGFLVVDNYWLVPKREKTEGAKGRLWTIEPKDVETVTIKRRGETIRLKRVADGWEMLEPVKARGDRGAVDEVVTSLATLRSDRGVGPNPDKLGGAKVKEFLDEPRPLTPYGLDKPSSVTIWLGKDKDRTSKTLLFGKVDKAKKGVYVERQGEAEVLMTADEVWDKLPRTVAAARDKVVFTYAYDKVSRVELDHARGKVTLERDGITWKITAPEALTADTGVVNGLLWRLRDLRASGFLDESASGIARYLAKPAVIVRVWEEGAKEPRTFLLTQSKDLKAGETTGVAATAGQGPVVMVESKAVTDLEKTATVLRDKTVVASFDMKEVKRVRVVAGDKRLVVEKRGEDSWRVVEGGKGAAKDFKVTGLLLALRALRWKDIAAPDASQAQKFGLDKPEVEVTVLKGDGTEMAKLAIGRSEDKAAYVQSKSAPGVYVVDPATLDEIRKAPTDIPG